jgi:putative transposase
MHTMTTRQGKSGTIDIKAVLAEDEEFLRALVRTALQEVLEAEMTEALGAEKGERAAGRQGYRSGYETPCTYISASAATSARSER